MNFFVVYLLYPTSNRNFGICLVRLLLVVYLLYPTSNRNHSMFSPTMILLYISFILHQTATLTTAVSFADGCISPLSYIKPQLVFLVPLGSDGCISPLSYIKPQHLLSSALEADVVYLLYPTSNRNNPTADIGVCRLYISFILHQTATIFYVSFSGFVLYISFILHQTATSRWP